MTSLLIGPDDAGQRLDRFLRKVLPQNPLGQIFRGLRRGSIRVNGKTVDGAYRLCAGDAVECGPGFAPSAVRAPVEVRSPGKDIEVLHRDADLLVVAKPSGLALHSGSGVHDDLVARVRAQFGAGRGHTFRIAPAHRIDRDTSGLVVFGLSAPGLRGFAELLRQGAVEKTYLALVHGTAPEGGDIDLALARQPDRRTGPRMVADAEVGIAAHTRFVRLAQRGANALLAVQLLTGRTHQIRVHLASRGLPIVGDRRYGRDDRAARLHLHAWRLRCRHPVTGADLAVESPPPAALRP
ncbi:MAG: RluA family pseudouridine synthase [Planctomycetota bacterium]